MDALLETGFLEEGPRVRGGKPAAGAPDLMALVVDELACGVMVLTLEGKTLDINQVARRELSRAGLLEAGGNLPSDSSSDNGKTLLCALARVAEGKRSLINLAVEGGSLSLAVVPLKGGPGTPTRAALVFARATIHDSLMLGFFARSYGLTVTEEHVLGILCQGCPTPAIAAQMNVAVSTVPTHVRSLCAKTRSSGVRELVSRVAMLPPVAPAELYDDQVH